MQLKYLPLNDALYRYTCAHRSEANDPLLAQLRRENENYGDDAICQISEEQGSFLRLLTSAISARSAIEVGTFTGYSSISIARGLVAGGRLICVDQSEEWTNVARENWRRAGVADKIELRLGPAIPTLQKLEAGLTFDFAFIDAAKTEYDQYFELILPHVRKNGLIVLDNMLLAGQLTLTSIPDEPRSRAIDALNHKLAADSRVETVLLPVADGIQICRKI